MKRMLLLGGLLAVGVPLTALAQTTVRIRREANVGDPTPGMRPPIITARELQQFAAAGLNLVVDASVTETSTLRVLAEAAGTKGSHLTIVNAQYKSTTELLRIAEKYPHNITLDFRE